MKLNDFKTCNKWIYPTYFTEMISLLFALKDKEKNYNPTKLYVCPIPKDLFQFFMIAVSILVENGFYNEDFINNVSFEIQVV